MRVGFDLDGVLNGLGQFNTNLKLPWLFFVGLIFIRPNKKAVKVLKELDERDIIIVSARPRQLEGLTKACFRFYKVPFHNLFCVGGLGKDAKEQKLEVIKQMKIEKFIDNDPEIVKFLQENGINAMFPQDLKRCLTKN